MIEGIRISYVVDAIVRSPPCNSSAFPAKSIFTARWKLVTFNASYVKFNTSTSLIRWALRVSFADERHARLGKHLRYRQSLVGG